MGDWTLEELREAAEELNEAEDLRDAHTDAITRGYLRGQRARGIGAVHLSVRAARQRYRTFADLQEVADQCQPAVGEDGRPLPNGGRGPEVTFKNSGARSMGRAVWFIVREGRNIGFLAMVSGEWNIFMHGARGGSAGGNLRRHKIFIRRDLELT